MHITSRNIFLWPEATFSEFETCVILLKTEKLGADTGYIPPLGISGLDIYSPISKKIMISSSVENMCSVVKKKKWQLSTP